MGTHRISVFVASVALAVLLAACDPTSPAAPVPQDVAYGSSPKMLGPDFCAFGQPFSLVSTSPYFPLTVGSWWELSGEDDGEPIRLRIDILDQTEVVGGVTTRVLKETEWVDGVLAEQSYNYFAENADGVVCYFGEAVDIFENGQVSHQGAWRADQPGNAPGLFMPADPQPGMMFQMEIAPGVAEDEGKIVGTGAVTVPAGTFTQTIRVREFNPLDAGKDYKWYAAGVGILIDGPLLLNAFLVVP
jgi:hypothetical protein